MTLRVDHPAFLITIYGLAAAFALYLFIRPTLRRTLAGFLCAVIAGLLGWFLVWFSDNVMNIFGVGLTPITTMWVAFGFAGTALALANLFRSRWWRMIVAIVSIPIFLLAAAAGINVDFGAYRDLNDVFGVIPYKTINFFSETGEVINGTDWAASTTPTSDVPAKGEVAKVSIPATVSRFPARDAVVYLPPIALTANPPALPVLYALSGQPGAPINMFGAGRLAQFMNAFAAQHRGYAPIVIAADQLGGPGRNPMCVNSRALGNAETYLLTDVRHWAESHLRVSRDPAAWGVFGFSEGATCAVQFATGHPGMFGSAIASSSELGPTLGNTSKTIELGFNGSHAAYERAQPINIMAAHRPYKHTIVILGAGQNDLKYSAFARILYAHAVAADIDTQLFISPGTAHDWNTVRYTLDNGFPSVADMMGLTKLKGSVQ